MLVGGSAACAATLLIRRRQQALLAALAAAAAILAFETVEVVVIGSPEGVARNLQILYFAIGGAIGAGAVMAQRTDRKAAAAN